MKHGYIFHIFFKLVLIGLFALQSGCGGSSGGSHFIMLTAPTGVTATITGVGQITISWNSVASATSYNIYRSTTPGSTGTYIANVAASPYVDKGLTNGITYYYVVTALNGYSESSDSTQVSATLISPPAPSSVIAVAGNQQVTLSWSGVPGATSYNIYWSTAPLVTKLTGTQIPVTSTPYTHTLLTNGTPYYYVVTSVNSIYGEGAESSEVSATPSAGATAGIVNIKVEYEDKEYGTGGFTGVKNKAVRYADVEIIDAGTGNPVISSTTNTAGACNISFAPTGGDAYYVRVISSATLSASSRVDVKTLSGALYGVGSADFVPSGAASVSMAISTQNQAGGAFNIMDVMTSGFEFVNAQSGTWPPALPVYWEAYSAEGTYYCTGVGCPRGEGIYVRGYYNGDTDGYDDDVIWHEFGHFIASKYSRDDSPGGYHYLSGNDYDLRLTWSEGWGDFFPGAVKTWLNATEPDLVSSVTGTPAYYVDTYGSGAGISFNFGNPIGSSYYYASNEVAVAKVLLSLMNNGSFGMQPVWGVVSSFTSTNPATPVNLEAFWDGWKLQRSSTFASEKATLEAIYGDRKIFYKEDPFEADNDDSPILVSRATFTINGPGETHYLYKNDGSSDVDIIPFDVVSGMTYTIRTVQLHNGTDTYMRIISDSTGTYVSSAVNDNDSGSFYTPPFNCDAFWPYVCHENGNDLLGSEIILPDTTPSGRYYVEISSSPSRPASAGRYGTYTLTITSP